MAKDPLNTPARLFANNEVIDLCKSIIDIHRALKSLAQFLGDLEDQVHTGKEAAKNDFQLWGIRAVFERFMTDQNLKLTRIMEIYKAETDKLVQKTNNKESGTRRKEKRR